MLSKNALYFIIIIGVVGRRGYGIALYNADSEDYWKYGYIANNLKEVERVFFFLSGRQ